MSVDSPVRVLVAAPTPSLGAELAALVRAGGFALVGQVEDLEDAPAPGTADVVVVAAGTPISREAIADLPGVLIVGIEDPSTEQLARAGGRVVSFVHADGDASTLGAAIAAVAAGLSVRPADAPIAATANGRRTSAIRDGDADVEGIDSSVEPEALTTREIDVLDALAQGLSNRAIAARLGISEHTVKFHLASIFGKLGVATRTAAVRRALRRGLIDL